MNGRMTGEHLDAILKLAGAKPEKSEKAEKDGGWTSLPEGNTMTLHVAHDGAAMTVPRVESLKQEGELVYARNPKRELFVVVRSDIFAVALENDATAGRAVRRAGF